jgi:hypothetical protein
MRIGIIGGVERNESQYHRVAATAGHEIEFHPGHIQGRGQETLTALVARCDVVVIITDVNSHGAVKGAREIARRAGRTPIFTRRFGTSRLSAIFAEHAHAA